LNNSSTFPLLLRREGKKSLSLSKRGI